MGKEKMTLRALCGIEAIKTDPSTCPHSGLRSGWSVFTSVRRSNMHDPRIAASFGSGAGRGGCGQEDCAWVWRASG